MAIPKNEVEKYLTETKLIVLATVNENNAPSLRVLGAFGVDGYSFYYSTKGSAAKVKHTDKNPQVTALFQHENQDATQFINVSIQGKAVQLSSKTEIDKAIEVIGSRSAKFKERVAKNGLDNNVLYRVDPQEVKVLDRRKGTGTESINVITF
jgi:nitroimidazol reductase NimA-like FMN-containing flavoprotein (pyridoxamine 5'-phosphate oxidase superfamily)